jgi:hypothetical protein
MASMLETLELTPFQKGMLRDRWLDQLAWMGRKARETRRSYLIYRLPVVVGGVLIPALVTILLSSGDDESIGWLGGFPVDGIRFLAFAVSLLVAICAGIEELLHFGDRWRHYRRTAELLKTLGWQYLMLSGVFRRYANHGTAFAPFTERVEDVLNEDVEGYLGAMAGDGSDRARHEVIA